MIKPQILFSNVDNIARTKAYERFGKEHPEIRWARLAGMVSRNAGWNMTDLANASFRTLLPAKERKLIAWIYERANWLIFADAYPQLLIYKNAKKRGQRCFSELDQYGISSFMKKEWYRFMEERDENRLMTALIINEQFVLQSRLLDSLTMETFFHSALYKMEELAHFSHVVMPGIGQPIYGQSISSFADPVARIDLGKRLASLLYHPELNDRIIAFTKHTEPSGSRRDYDRNEHALPLRVTYPRYQHEPPCLFDWYKTKVENEVERLFMDVYVKPKKVDRLLIRTKAELKLLAWIVDKLK